MIPQDIGVAGSEAWKCHNIRSISEYKSIEKKMDWSFSSPYKGEILRVSSQEQLQQELKLISSNDLNLVMNFKTPQRSLLRCKEPVGESEIPQEMLRAPSQVLF